MSLEYIISPNKRVYFVYLATSFLLAFYVYHKTKIRSGFLNYVFNKKVWLGKSPSVDYGFLFFNSLVKVVLLAPIIVYGVSLAFWTEEFLQNKLGIYEGELSPAFLLRVVAQTQGVVYKKIPPVFISRDGYELPTARKGPHVRLSSSSSNRTLIKIKTVYQGPPGCTYRGFG